MYPACRFRKRIALLGDGNVTGACAGVVTEDVFIPVTITYRKEFAKEMQAALPPLGATGRRLKHTCETGNLRNLPVLRYLE